ncbi:MAG: threonine synthase [Fervidicoccaceae archaeon]
MGKKAEPFKRAFSIEIITISVRRCEPNALVCDKCGKRYSIFDRRLKCECGGLLHFEIGLKDIKPINLFSKNRGVWKYRSLIPLPDNASLVTMGEGSTPLVKLNRLKEELKTGDLYLKLEGSNPTGSFKDRGMTVAISAAKLMGAKRVVSASTGNTAASMCAYARRGGMEPVVLIPKGKVAGGKISQLSLYNAKVFEVPGNFDLAMNKALDLMREDPNIYLMNSVNPWRIEGQKTVAFEIVEEFGSPDWIVVPVGNGGNIYSIWKGLNELKILGFLRKMPRLLAVQASGASPIVKSLWQGNFVEVESPSTVATAISIGKPVHWERALKAIKESNGAAVAVEDDEILSSQSQLARFEGVGVESASAATLAGLKKALLEGIVDRRESAVLIGTGNALKESDVLPLRFPLERIQLEKTIEIFRG